MNLVQRLLVTLGVIGLSSVGEAQRIPFPFQPKHQTVEQTDSIEELLAEYGHQLEFAGLPKYVSPFPEVGAPEEYEQFTVIQDKQGDQLFPPSLLRMFERRGISPRYMQEILSYRGKDGNIILKSPLAILEAHEQGVPTSFFEATAPFLKNGGSCDEVVSLWNSGVRESFLTTYVRDGKTLLSLEHLFGVHSEGITPGYISELTTEAGDLPFSPAEVVYLFKHCAQPKEAAKLRDIKRLDGERLFDGWVDHLVEYMQARGTVEFAEVMASMTNEGGHPLFSGWDTLLFHKGNKTHEFWKNILLTSECYHLPLEREALLAIEKQPISFEFIEGMAQLPVWWDSHFWHQVVSYKQAWGTVEEAQALAALKNKAGEPLLTGEQIVFYRVNGGDVGTAKKLDGKLSHGSLLTWYQQLGWSEVKAMPVERGEEDYTVALLAGTDYNNAFGNGTSVQKVKRFSGRSTLVLFPWETEEDYKRGLELVKVLRANAYSTGHGCRMSFTGSRRILVPGTDPEFYRVDISDESLLEETLTSLPPGIFFSASCSFFAGGVEGVSVGNMMRRHLRDWTITGATEPFCAGEIHVMMDSPFYARIIDSGTNKDIGLSYGHPLDEMHPLPGFFAYLSYVFNEVWKRNDDPIFIGR